MSIGSPADALAGFRYNADIAWTSMWIFSLVILLIGNALFWQSGRSWAMWSTLVFFALCSVAKTILLDYNFAKFTLVIVGASSQSQRSGTLGPTIWSLIVDTGLIIIATAIVYFDHFIVSRLRAKTYPEQITPSDPTRSKQKSSSSTDKKLFL